MNRNYYMELLEGRAKRLNELLAMAAPTDMICREVMLVTEAATPLEPQAFHSWNYNKWLKETHESEEYQRCAATG